MAAEAGADKLDGGRHLRSPWAELLLDGRASKATTDRDPELLQTTLRGSLPEDWQNEKLRLVSVFYSSTFTDTVAERDVVIADVHPYLRRLGQVLGVECQIAEMRWGIRSSAQAQNLTAEMCMAELERCKQLSSGISYVLIHGDKYGYQPLPHTISSDEWDLLLSNLAVKPTGPVHEKRALLLRWYICDRNCVPAEWKLQSLVDAPPNTSSYVQAALREAALAVWPDAMDRVRHYQDHPCVKYFASVTLEEAVNGGVGDAALPGQPATAFAYRRTIRGLPQAVSDDVADTLGAFRDLSWIHTDGNDQADQAELDEDAAATMQALGENIVCPTHQYDVSWDGLQNDPVQEVQAFADHFCQLMADQMREVAQTLNHTPDATADECIIHLRMAHRKASEFVSTTPQAEVIQAVTQRLGAEQRGITVVHGRSGSGKTSVMAVAFGNVVQRSQATQCVSTEETPTFAPTSAGAVAVVKFVGMSALTGTSQSLLTSLCSQLSRARGGDDEPAGKPIAALAARLQELLAQATAAEPIVLFLDSLDQLSDPGTLLDWLPMRAPPHVHLVLSVLEGESQGDGAAGLAHRLLRRALAKGTLDAEGTTFVPVKQLSTSDGDAMIDGLLHRRKRQLTPGQRKVIMDGFQKEPSPLYIQAALHVAESQWTSFTSDEDVKLGSNVREVIGNLFEVVEDRHGEMLTAAMCSLILIAKDGLTMTELDDVLSLDDDVLNDVYEYWTPPTRRIPSRVVRALLADLGHFVMWRGARDGSLVITWAHRQLWEEARLRYCTAGTEVRHQQLVEYFRGDWAHTPKPYQVLGKRSTPVAASHAATNTAQMLHGDDLTKAGTLPWTTKRRFYGLFVDSQGRVLLTLGPIVCAELVHNNAMLLIDHHEKTHLLTAASSEAASAFVKAFKAAGVEIGGFASARKLSSAVNPAGPAVVKHADRKVAPQPFVFDQGTARGWKRVGRHLNVRALVELPHHLIHAGDADAAEDLLCDLEFCEAKIEAGMLPELIAELRAACEVYGDEGPLREQLKFLSELQPVLQWDSTAIVQAAYSFPDSTRVAAQARAVLKANSRPYLDWVTKPQTLDQTELVLSTDNGDGVGVLSCDYSPQIKDGGKSAPVSRYMLICNGHHEGELRREGLAARNLDARHRLYVWDRLDTAAAPLKLMDQHAAAFTCCRFDRAGTRVAAVDVAGTLHVFGLLLSEEGTLDSHEASLHVSLTSSALTSCAWSPKGDAVFVSEMDGIVHVVRPGSTDTECLNSRVQIKVDHPLVDVSAHPSQDGLLAVTTDQGDVCLVRGALGAEPKVEPWLDLGLRTERPGPAYSYPMTGCLACEWSEERLAVACPDGSIRVFEAEPGSEASLGQFRLRSTPSELDKHQKTVSGLAWSADGQQLASISADKLVRVWGREADGGGWWSEVLGSVNDVGWSVSWSPDVHWLMVGNRTGFLRAWRLPVAAPGKLDVAKFRDNVPKRNELSCHEGPVNCVAWSRDGLSVASAGDDGVINVFWKIREAADGPLLLQDVVARRHRITGHTSSVYDVSWSPSNQLVTCDASGQLCITPLTRPDGVLLGTEVIAAQTQSLNISEARCRCSRFSPDGLTIAAGSDAGDIYLLRASSDGGTWAVAAQAAKEPADVVSVDWHPSGKHIATRQSSLPPVVWSVVGPDCDVLQELQTAGQDGVQKATFDLARPPKAWCYPTTVRWSPDGSVLASDWEHTNILYTVFADQDGVGGPASSLRAPDQARDYTLIPPGLGDAHAKCFCGATRWDPSSRYVASTCVSGTLRVWYTRAQVADGDRFPSQYCPLSAYVSEAWRALDTVDFRVFVAGDPLGSIDFATLQNGALL